MTVTLLLNSVHAIVSFQQNIVVCPMYPEAFIRDSVFITYECHFFYSRDWFVMVVTALLTST